MKNRSLICATALVITTLGGIAPGGAALAQIYPPIDSAAADIKAAVAEAHRTHKPVILAFGGDWCPDCQVLNIYFHQRPNAERLAKYFIRVNVDVGRMDAQQEIAGSNGVPLKGVPALAVLDGTGRSLYAQN